VARPRRGFLIVDFLPAFLAFTLPAISKG